LAAAIEALATRVSRLTISHRDPEAFFVARSDLAAELRAIARALLAARRQRS
jgi:hypothetical protein